MGFLSKFKKEEKTYEDTDIIAIANGSIIPVENVNDPVFSKQMLGQTLAMELHDNIILAPCNGTLKVMYSTGHAFAIKRDDGLGILVHIGLNTVNLKGKGFKIYAKQGEQVKAGQKLIKINYEEIKEAGYDLTTLLIITDQLPEQEAVQFICQGEVKRGDIINKI